MNVLVIGSGGREHALVWKLSQSPNVRRVTWTPGNPAAPVSKKVGVRSAPVDDLAGLAALARAEKINLTVVGPEAPLVAGLANEFRRLGISVFGPTREAARLEGSKAFSKRFFLKHGIPTGRAEIFAGSKEAIAYAASQPKPLVIKADGLAAGKGVLICNDQAEAERAIRQIMDERVFGEAGREVLVEECLSGPEVSVHAITDGKTFHLLAGAQDHKRVFDDDQGPNTGGMGAYSPAPILTPNLEDQVRREIFMRTLAGLRAEGIPFCGILYAGLMLTKDGPKILEYNCRFGDPETQVLLPRIKNDLAEALLAASEGRLQAVRWEWSPRSAVCIVLAAGGYPSAYRKGDVIQGLAEATAQPETQIFHAGTALRGSEVVTQGGRVLGVTALGADTREAVRRAYAAADMIRFEGRHFRRDIAAKALTAG